ncbi:MAG: dTDP-4-dehydrorhamnose 3,5-epimerase [Saprospiraceae bacterium]|nr:MAG: dTDP-4-dehydrorhamnose 3,5-epimerase [Bacteroidetes bacterium OLB9]MCO6463991.1 dTDP-4-dehydrorhamnose 3,5-epimerase [Saprospiraceae bacterium]MCZ2337009.1 dTDP-4-dehydrorhamnose 3,5-epimerase [Chitinophagales bacterium]
MAWEATHFEGVWTYTPKVFKDERGYFMESFNEATLPESLKNTHFVQDNEAASIRGVARGLHYQVPPFTQSKLVRCVIGEVMDIIVDIRPDSATYGQSMSILLSEVNKMQLFVPQGFAHGYIVLSENALFAYKVDGFYRPEAEAGIQLMDPDLELDLILSDDELIISPRDQQLPLFKNHRIFK